ncbi:ABC transporter permease [Candidatus Parcubacteria bacterium]|nr:MAG: ABC transporter permease [Candidatus Parcubacteria bacterium]
MNIKTVGKYIRRSPYQALSAMLIMTLTFFTISVFSILTILSVKLINYFESKPQLTVFFKDTTVKEEIDSIQNQLELTGKSLSIKYVSKEEALEIYKEQNKSDPILLELVTSDILPASIEIQAVKAEYLADLASTVKKSPLVDQVVFQKDIVDTLISWTNAFRMIGLGVISVLAVVSIFVILTIIGIKITIRREEIEILKLIGASNWFIRLPFLFEGMFYGFVGALAGWSLSVGFLLYATPTLQSFLKGIPIFPISPEIIIGLLGAQIIFACFLGIFASFLAVLRYLK